MITLGCGSEVETQNLFIKADRARCASVEARIANVTLSSPVNALFSMLNNSQDFPDLDHHRVAREDLYRAVQIQLTGTSSRGTVDSARLRAIAAPLVTKLTRTARLHTSGPSAVVDLAQACVTGAVACAVSLVLQALFRCIAATGGRRWRRTGTDLPKGAATSLVVQAPSALPMSLKDSSLSVVTFVPQAYATLPQTPAAVVYNKPSLARLEAHAELTALLARHQVPAKTGSPSLAKAGAEQV